MRIFKMLALVLMGLHLFTCTQEEPIVDYDEQIEQEQPAEYEPTEEEPVEEFATEQMDQPEELTSESAPEITEEPAATEEPDTVESMPTEQEPAEQQAFEAEPMEQNEAVETMPTEPQTFATLPTEPQSIEIPAVPEPTIEDASTIIEEAPSQRSLGIDTVSLEDPQGNWLFKRIWWERAEDAMKKYVRLLMQYGNHVLTFS